MKTLWNSISFLVAGIIITHMVMHYKGDRYFVPLAALSVLSALVLSRMHMKDVDEVLDKPGRVKPLPLILAPPTLFHLALMLGGTLLVHYLFMIPPTGTDFLIEWSFIPGIIMALAPMLYAAVRFMKTRQYRASKRSVL